MSKALKTLDQHNAERIAMYEALRPKHYNGIACPTCAAELYDTNPNTTCTSDPPRIQIGCKCGFSGYRFA